MSFAHAAGLPLEELLALAPAASALWLALRARVKRDQLGAHSRGA
jgi:hypothetical protein